MEKEVNVTLHKMKSFDFTLLLTLPVWDLFFLKKSVQFQC